MGEHIITISENGREFIHWGWGRQCQMERLGAPLKFTERDWDVWEPADLLSNSIRKACRMSFFFPLMAEVFPATCTSIKSCTSLSSCGWSLMFLWSLWLTACSDRLSTLEMTAMLTLPVRGGFVLLQTSGAFWRWRHNYIHLSIFQLPRCFEHLLISWSWDRSFGKRIHQK